MSSSVEGTVWQIREEKGNKTVACGDGNRDWRLSALNPSMCLFEHRETRWFVAHPK